MSLARKAAMIICAAIPLLAAPRLTTIQDSIYKADGTRFNGTAVISWVPFDTSDNSKIGLQSLTVQITNGAFRVQLVPNSDATPVNYYTVQYSSDGKQQFTETWSVPPSTTPLHIKDVQVTISTGSTTGSTGGGVVQPPSQTPITESNVIGLLTDLSLRPIKGGAFGTGRTAVVDDSGALNTAEGNLSDCVRVDGSAGPCFDSSLLPAFIDSETPAGVVDGVNATFTLANTLTPTGSLSLYRNGLLQQAGADFNLQTDGSILFVSAAVPQPGDILLASYRTAASSSSLVAAQTLKPGLAQILCSASGTSTTGSSNVSLGSCVIPAGTLAVGDRVEIRFNLAHQGITNGFVFLVRWGQATMVQRTAASLDGIVTGQGDASPGPGGTSLDMQTWGSVLPLDSKVATASDPLTADIKVDFLASMNATGSDNVSLQNYTILRYPAQ